MFLQDSLDLFLNKRTSHMGPHQYVAHAGMRDGKSMSGATLWYEAEKQRLSNGSYLVDAERSLLKEVAEEIENYLPKGMPVIDLGPGTVGTFQSKVLPIISALNSSTYIPVDESLGFLKELLSHAPKDMDVFPVLDNFFENDQYYYRDDALICSFGSTISNIEHPISKTLPETSLVKSLLHLSYATRKGALLVAFDSKQDGERIKAYYKKHALFQLNIFYRMAVELPMDGFNPSIFEYEPLWIPEAGQLAHVAVVTKDTSFCLGEHQISLRQGDKLHLKNSYKFTPDFFARACNLAGLGIINTWNNPLGAEVYLLKVPAASTFLSAYPLQEQRANTKASATVFA